MAVEFNLRNYSPTQSVRIVLKLASSELETPDGDILPPIYLGQLTQRTILEPLGNATIFAKISATRPGTYGIIGWRVETDVLENNGSDPAIDTTGNCVNFTEQHIKRRYVEVCPIHNIAIFTVVQQI